MPAEVTRWCNYCGSYTEGPEPNPDEEFICDACEAAIIIEMEREAEERRFEYAPLGGWDHLMRYGYD
jgi:hypothetical protein